MRVNHSSGNIASGSLTLSRQQRDNNSATCMQHTCSTHVRYSHQHCSRSPQATDPQTRSKNAHTSWPGVSLSWRACCSLLRAQIYKGGRESGKLNMRSRIRFQLYTLPWPGNRALEGPDSFSNTRLRCLEKQESVCSGRPQRRGTANVPKRRVNLEELLPRLFSPTPSFHAIPCALPVRLQPQIQIAARRPWLTFRDKISLKKGLWQLGWKFKILREANGLLSECLQSSLSRVSIMIVVHALPSSNDLKERYIVRKIYCQCHHKIWTLTTLCLTLASSIYICATQGKLSLSVSGQNYVIANKSMRRSLQCFFHFLANRPSEGTRNTISAKERHRNLMIDFAPDWFKLIQQEYSNQFFPVLTHSTFTNPE